MNDARYRTRGRHQCWRRHHCQFRALDYGRAARRDSESGPRVPRQKV